MERAHPRSIGAAKQHNVRRGTTRGIIAGLALPDRYVTLSRPPLP